jgi:glycerol transport system substrate-binding protein
LDITTASGGELVTVTVSVKASSQTLLPSIVYGYPKLAQLWWQNIGDVNSGAFTPQQAMDRLAQQMDDVMARMQVADEKDKVYGGCGPRLNTPKDPREWLGKPNGPKAKDANEKPKGETQDYDELDKSWARR